MSPDCRPLGRLQRRDIDLGLELDGLHHLPDETINNDHDDHTVLLCQFEGIDKQVHTFLDRRGSYHNTLIVPISAPLDRWK